MKKIRIIEAAELELNDASEYYESQAKGLGFLFLDDFAVVIFATLGGVS